MSVDGWRLRYYTPLNGERTFWKTDRYCCPNNFRRAMARLPEFVMYAQGADIFANLYSACVAELRVGGTDVRIVEETDYPKVGRVKFTMHPAKPTCFGFKVRVPRWCRNPSVAINGKEVPYKDKRPGKLLNLPKTWKDGDVVELDFPMEVRTVRGRKRQSGRFAVMRGPVLYALDTHSIPAFKDTHPYDAQTVMMLDPKRLKYRDGKIAGVVSTVDWAVGIADVGVDRDTFHNPKNVSVVELVPFASEKATLTYFRAPNIEDDCREEDELFGPCAAARR